MIGGGEEERELRKERRWEKGQEERRRRGMNVGQLQQLPVSHQSGGGEEDKVGGRKICFSLGRFSNFPRLPMVLCELVIYEEAGL